MSGWKDWAIGEVVTESDFQAFVQDQVVQVYDDATARDNTLGTSVTEGMIAYLKDTNQTQAYDGTAWVNVGEAGDITAVTAGTALTGGGTAGDVTLDVDIAAVGSAVTIAQSQVTDLVTDLGDKQDDVITTQGDLVTGDASGDPVRLGIGTADQVLTSDGTALTWADASGGLPIGTAGYTALSNGTAGLSYQPVSHNYIINGAFDIDQLDENRTTNGYFSDMWKVDGSGATFSAGRFTFTDGEFTVDGFGEIEHFAKFDVTSGNNNARIIHEIEDVRTLAGQTVTLSFWAKGTNPGGGQMYLRFDQYFNSASGSSVYGDFFTLSSSWQKYSLTFNLNDLSGKTIGTNSGLEIWFMQPGGDNSSDPWELFLTGVQLEAGSIATPFKRSASSVQGELKMCQRYLRVYQRNPGTSFALGYADNSTTGYAYIFFEEPMKSAPSLSSTGSYRFAGDGDNFRDANFESLFTSVNTGFRIEVSPASGTFTQGYAYALNADTGGATITARSAIL